MSSGVASERSTDTPPQGSRAAKAERIRTLNDAFRHSGHGGRILITCGVQAMGSAFIARALRATRRFDAFDGDNDPYHEHDFGAFSIDGERVFFKIDCYDRTLTMGSPDPTNAAVTCRVMTVMLASEY